MNIPFLDLKREYEFMKEEIDNAIKNCLNHQKWILGPEVKELEEKVSGFIGVKNCLGVASGTDALVISLRSLAIKLKGKNYWDREDLIITTPFTFTATGDAILRSGATPLFVDIKEDTFNIDEELIEEAIQKYGEKVVGIVCVHLYGNPCEIEKIKKIAEEYNIFVVEDCAQSFGAKHSGKMTGSFGDINAFSFFPTKNLGGYGDGGIITTDDDTLYEISDMLRKHGGRDKYNVDFIGYNSRLDTIQAGILLVKMKYIEEFNSRRIEIASVYNENFKDIDFIEVIKEGKDKYNVYNTYTIKVKDSLRNRMREFLNKNGISTAIYYPFPLHKMRVFEGNSIIYGSVEISEKLCKKVLSLPVFPFLQENEKSIIITTIKKFERKKILE